MYNIANQCVAYQGVRITLTERPGISCVCWKVPTSAVQFPLLILELCPSVEEGYSVGHSPGMVNRGNVSGISSCSGEGCGQVLGTYLAGDCIKASGRCHFPRMSHTAAPDAHVGVYYARKPVLSLSHRNTHCLLRWHTISLPSQVGTEGYTVPPMRQTSQVEPRPGLNFYAEDQRGPGAPWLQDRQWQSRFLVDFLPSLPFDCKAQSVVDVCPGFLSGLRT